MLYHQTDYSGIYLNDELSQYVDIGFKQVFNNYFDKDGNYYKYKTFKAKQCTQDDFGNSEKEKEFFDAWSGGSSLICPDFPKGEGFTLKGSPADMVSENILFYI